MSSRPEAEVEIEGRRLKLSNLDKIFYPATGFTKGQVIDYYIRVAPALLPHLRDRPLTLKRYPNGVTGAYFYEKRCPSHRPSWVRTEPVWSGANQDVIDFCVVDELATLVWAANLADLELHTYLHRVPQVDRPTMVVFDLDPGPPADVVQCCEVALLLRALFERLGLESFAKTSGSKGIQVYLPLNTPVGYDATKAFAREVAEVLEAERRDLVVSSMKKALRAGKVLVDWSQNDRHKTTVCVWSLRARERPTVSAPVRWEEIEATLRERDAGRLVFDAGAALRRLARDGDLFAPVLTLEQELPKVRLGARSMVASGASGMHVRGPEPRGGLATPSGERPRQQRQRAPRQSRSGERPAGGPTPDGPEPGARPGRPPPRGRTGAAGARPPPGGRRPRGPGGRRPTTRQGRGHPADGSGYLSSE